MDERFLQRMADRLQRERRELVDELSRRGQTETQLPGDVQPELEEQAQSETAFGITEALSERHEERLRNIDDALARIEAGNYGRCRNCDREISRQRLEADATTTLCEDCAGREEADAAGQVQEDAVAVDLPERGALPPDLDGMDDGELQEYLRDLVQQDGQVDMQELEILARNGVVHLEGALPSEPERAILLKILTDVAGVQDIVDNLEVERLAWEREERWKEQDIQDVPPGTMPDREPYGGTEDVVLSEEEGINYEPPENPPAPPNRKD